MTDEKEGREREPVLEDLVDAFAHEFTEVAEAGLANHPEPIDSDVLEKIRDQTAKAVEQSAQALSEAIYPNLVQWWDSKVFPLSQSILQQQASFQQVVAPASSAQTITNRVTEQTHILEETLNLTQSVVTVNTSSGVDLSSLILWRWNETDVDQFDTSTPIQVGKITASMAYVADSDDQIGPRIRFTVTSTSPGGYATWRIAPAESLTLPDRFLFRVRFASHSLANKFELSSLYMGPFFHNGSWDVINLFGFGATSRIEGAFCIIPQAAGSGSTPAGPGLLVNRPFKATSGTPQCNDYTSSATIATGMTCEYEVYLNWYSHDDPPFGSITQRRLGGYTENSSDCTIHTSESLLRGNGTPYAGALEAAWYGQQINEFSWMIVTDSTSGVTDLQYEIADLCILKHPSDW